MAACLVTVSGTSGSVLIEYVDAGSVARSLVSSITTSLYIDDAGSAYTYTTLSGDATATSGCITITALPKSCFLFSWEFGKPAVSSLAQTFDRVIIGASEYSIAQSPYTYDSNLEVVNSINALNNLGIKATAYKTVLSTDATVASQAFIILTTKGSTVPYLRIRNTLNNKYVYLKGELTATCLPAGYTQVPTCDLGSIFLP